MNTATLSVKGQIVIPKQMRLAAQVSFGDEFAISFSNGEIRLRPLTVKKHGALDAVAACLARPAQGVLSEAAVKAAIMAKLKAKHSANRASANHA